MNSNRLSRIAALAALLLFFVTSKSYAQIPAITAATVSVTEVTISGTNLQWTVQVTIDGTDLTNIVPNAAGTQVTGNSPTILASGQYSLALTAVTSSQSGCFGSAPAASWVCVGGAWVPANHPLALSLPRQTITFQLLVGGAVATSEYAHVYNLGPGQTLSAGTSVVFNANGLMSSGITHAPGDSAITVNRAGVYEVTFGVAAVATIVRWAVFVNNVPNASLAVYASNGVAIGATGLVQLQAGDVLTLRPTSSTGVLNGFTVDAPNAFIVIRKIN